MDESEENMNGDRGTKVGRSSSADKKPKKRSIIERQLETNLTSRITSPVRSGDGLSTSRYGRARRLRTESEQNDLRKAINESLKSPVSQGMLAKTQSPAYKMHASNSPCKKETPKKTLESHLDSQIDNIYEENKSLSRFSGESNKSSSPVKKYPKIYTRKDLLQNREEEETILLIKNLFSPNKSASKSSRGLLNQLDHSSEKKSYKQNGLGDNTSVVKTLDFDGDMKNKSDQIDENNVPHEDELLELEAKCAYQVGDIAWARMGTFPFWPCIVTREPSTELFVTKKKKFGRVEYTMIHVTFLADNGRRSWIADTMMRPYLGLTEFEETRRKFTSEDKKRDQKLYVAFFISKKKEALWNTSVQEAEVLFAEPKGLRIDIFNDMLWNIRTAKKQKGGKITRKDSDVSLSESLYDSLFSEVDIKSDDSEKSKTKSRNKSFDVSEVVTACLDNMAAKTGITKIQRQSHMDRWLQKAKSKTPEKIQVVAQVVPQNVEMKISTKDKSKSSSIDQPQKPYRLRRSTDFKSNITRKSNKKSTNHFEDQETHAENHDTSNQIAEVKTVSNSKTYENSTDDMPQIESQDLTNNIDEEPCTLVHKEMHSDNIEMKDVSTEDGVISLTDKKNEEHFHTNEQLNHGNSVNNDFKRSECEIVFEKENDLEEISENMNLSDVSENVVMEVDKASDVERATSDENCNLRADKSGAMSKVSVEDLKVQLPVVTVNNIQVEVPNDVENRPEIDTILNDFTSEAFVTEKKSDDTMIVEAVKTHESRNSPDIQSKKSQNNFFLENDHKHIAKSNEIPQFEIISSNTSTPQKKFACHEINKNVEALKNVLNKECIIIEDSSTDNTANLVKNHFCDDGEKNSCDDILNGSGNSESILQLTHDADLGDSDHTSVDSVVNASCAINDESVSMLHDYSTTESKDESDKPDSVSHCVNTSNNEDRYTESPTFTQPLDGEEHLNDDKEVSETKAGGGISQFVSLVEEDETLTSHKEKVYPTRSYPESSTQPINSDQLSNEANEMSEAKAKNDAASDKANNVCYHNENPSYDRSYSESPTFTQTLDSDNYFSDVNKMEITKKITDSVTDVMNKSSDNDESNINKLRNNFTSYNHANVLLEANNVEVVPVLSAVQNSSTNNQLLESVKLGTEDNVTYKLTDELSKNLCKDSEIKSQNFNNKATTPRNPESEEFEEEESSDDEPSPEYESLDEDITEDFRKHLKSIENHITDKKNEEQIVKICNEIAQKAKTSPIKLASEVKITSDLSKSKEIQDKQLRYAEEIAMKEGKLKEKWTNVDSMTEQNYGVSDASKLCNEIAEKAKLSSTKYVDASSENPEEKLERISRKLTLKGNFNNINDISDATQICNEIAEKAKISASKHVALTSDSSKLEVVEKEENSGIYTEFTAMDHKRQENLDDISLKNKENSEVTVNKLNSKDAEIKINGHAKEHEITFNVDKKFKKLSLRSKSKSLSHDVKSLKFKINEMAYTKREPKVLISSLDAEVVNTHIKKTMINSEVLQVEEMKSKCKNKSRLSLKKHSPKVEKIHDNIAFERKVEKNNVDVNSAHSFKKALLTLEKSISDPIKINGCHIHENRPKTPDLDDKDFDIDTASLNSEDSEVSLPQLVDPVPKRSLRSRPVGMTLEFALTSPEFLKYLELRQDFLLDEQPDLDENEVVTYLFKTWQYEEELKSDVKKSDDMHNSSLIKGIRQETPSRNKSRKSQPKHSLENKIREKYDNHRKPNDTDDVSSRDPAVLHSSDTIIKQDAPPFEASNNIKENDIQNNFDKCIITSDSIEPVTPISSDVCLKQDNILTESENNLKQIGIQDTLEENDRGINVDLVPSSYGEFAKENKQQLLSIEPAIESKSHSELPIAVNLIKQNRDEPVIDSSKNLESEKSSENFTPRKSLRSRTCTPKMLLKLTKNVNDTKNIDINSKVHSELETESVDSEDSDINLQQLRDKAIQECPSTVKTQLCINVDTDHSKETAGVANERIASPILLSDEAEDNGSDNEPLLKKKKKVKNIAKTIEDPEFIKYMELKQDALMDENPNLTHDELVNYLHKTWLYEENAKSEIEKNDEYESTTLIKGLSNNDAPVERKKPKRKSKIEKVIDEYVVPKEKPRRRIIQPYYNEEEYSDIENELEVFEIFKSKKTPDKKSLKAETITKTNISPKTSHEHCSKIDDDIVNSNFKGESIVEDEAEEQEVHKDQVELYYSQLTQPKPSVFKGLVREKVCEICERESNLVKCKGCQGSFHPECVKRQAEVSSVVCPLKTRGRKKKLSLKPKSNDDSGSQGDDKSQDVSLDMSTEEVQQSCTFDAEQFEAQLAEKMKELLANADANHYSYSSYNCVDWGQTVEGKCEIVTINSIPGPAVDYSDFKCNNCQKYNKPVCFVCKSAVTKSDSKVRQKCHVAHCHKYYHVECLEHWPQTQFISTEPSRNKKSNEPVENLTCPRHVCHTCVSDDPRGCKTRFAGDKLAKCVRCPATYHAFNKCLPAGTQILTASHIICPRHITHRAGKSCHVNTGWCFLCAQGGSLICCEYCPTSFHAECLNIKPPEGNYMCEDCETGRLPLYGEMVWVKLGQYRWWPGLILHPAEIPENLIRLSHGIGEFVVRFFGQYDHYWVNRGRVFPYQEGDTGHLSARKTKIDEAFQTAIEHAQRAYDILKNTNRHDDESLDIESSVLPPHYVKLKCNKPCGSLCGRRIEDPSLSLTQCECDPDDVDPCGPYSHCLNRMLLTECGPTCRAGERCNNRAFEKRLYPKMVPYRTPHRGWGLKTLEDIKTGQFVIEYVGELIDEEEFRRRMRRKHEIRDENFYFLTLDKERMIDAGPKGNLARFMNHCCEPNCETQKWTVLGDIRVGLFAIKDIPANTEVTFNYKLECEGIEKKRCMCGAKRCSGYIGAKPKQDESQSKKSKHKLPTKRTYKKKKLEVTSSPSTSKTKRLGRPPKPKVLTEIEKDLLIIKNATNDVSGESSQEEKTSKLKSNENSEQKTQKTLKRKMVSNTSEEVSISELSEPSAKRQKCDEKCEVGD